MATKVKVEDFGKARIDGWGDLGRDGGGGLNLRVSGYTKDPNYGDYWSDDLTRVEIQLSTGEVEDLIAALKKEAGIRD